MDVGLLLVWQNWHAELTDEEMLRAELDLGVRADTLGFDRLWSAEHHFTSYSMCPDNMQVMAYLAGRTQRIRLGTGAVILPWWEPLRVVEKLVLLDHLCEGRLLFGMGRGLARVEYDGFGQDMNASRERFDEAAAMILEGLRTGVMEHDGRHFHQPRVEIRPAPSAERSWDDRLFAVAMSPESIDTAADLGATMMSFIQAPIEKHMRNIDRWRDRVRRVHDSEPRPPALTDFTFCSESQEEAREVAHEYIGRYFLSIIEHYDLAGGHWRDTTGYGSYDRGARIIREMGLEEAASAYVAAQAWGTPEQILETYRRRLDVVGDFAPVMAVSFAGMPYELVRRSLTLLGERVVPELQRMGARATA